MKDFSENTKAQASVACKAFEDHAQNRHLTAAVKQALREQIPRKYLQIFTKYAPDGILRYSLVTAIANGHRCLSCGVYAAYGSNCKSVCAACRSAGVSPSDYMLARSKLTCVDRYGVDNPYKSEDIKARIRDTCLQRYGDTNAAGKNSRLRPKLDAAASDPDRLARMRATTIATMQRLHGPEVTHWLQAPGATEKLKKHYEQKYGKGITNPMKVPANRAHHAARMSELTQQGVFKDNVPKIEATLLSRYGVSNMWKDPEYMKSARKSRTGYEYPLQDPAALANFRKTCLARHGAPHHMQNQEVFFKTLTSSRTLHLYECSYKGHTYELMGSYELFFLRWALSTLPPRTVLSGRRVPSIKIETQKRSYYPDFYLTTLGKYIEIKSLYTLIGGKHNNFALLKSNKAKARACAALGIDLVWVLPDPSKSTMCKLPTDWYTWSRTKITRYLAESHKAVQIAPLRQFESRILHKFGSRA